MDARVIWAQAMKFTGSADSGFEVPLDADPTVGGNDDGFRPLELLAVGLAGCTAMDVISLLKKKRQEVTAFEVRVHADRAEEHPRSFTALRIEYIITGHSVDDAAVQRSIELSETKYCPAQAMLGQVVPIQSHYTIQDAA